MALRCSGVTLSGKLRKFRRIAHGGVHWFLSWRPKNPVKERALPSLVEKRAGQWIPSQDPGLAQGYRGRLRPSPEEASMAVALYVRSPTPAETSTDSGYCGGRHLE